MRRVVGSLSAVLVRGVAAASHPLPVGWDPSGAVVASCLSESTTSTSSN